MIKVKVLAETKSVVVCKQGKTNFYFVDFRTLKDKAGNQIEDADVGDTVYIDEWYLMLPKKEMVSLLALLLFDNEKSK